MEEELGRN